MSKGKKWSLPAMPPLSGCRGCGDAKWDFCPNCAKVADDPFKIHERTKCACGEKMTTQYEAKYGKCSFCIHKERESHLSPEQKAEQKTAWEAALIADMDRDNERGQAQLFRRVSR